MGELSCLSLVPDQKGACRREGGMWRTLWTKLTEFTAREDRQRLGHLSWVLKEEEKLAVAGNGIQAQGMDN